MVKKIYNQMSVISPYIEKSNVSDKFFQKIDLIINFNKILKVTISGIILVNLACCVGNVTKREMRDKSIINTQNEEKEICLEPNFKCNLKDIENIASKNYNDRIYKKNNDILKIKVYDNALPDILLMHYTACPSLRTIKIFTKGHVSSHYLVNKDGSINQFVDEKKRAWHAGVSYWNKNIDINTCSIGIENIGFGYWQGHSNSIRKSLHEGYLTFLKKYELTEQVFPKKISPLSIYNIGEIVYDSSKNIYECLCDFYYTPMEKLRGSSEFWYKWENLPLKNSLSKLSIDIVKRHKIVPNKILGHSDVAIGRKVDPGPFFPWEKLYGQGLGAWPEDDYKLSKDQCHCSISFMQDQLFKYGYRVPLNGKLDSDTEKVIVAFRMHYYNKEGLIKTPSLNAIKSIASLVNKYIKTNNWTKDSAYEHIYKNKNF